MPKVRAPRLRLGFSKRLLVIIIAVIVLVSSGIAVFWFARGYSSQDLPFMGGNEFENESEDLVKRVGEKILLPDEIPTIATVSDKSQLTGQAFFEKAENGDRVLIYPNSKIAVIYRPSIDKIINLGPVNLEEESQLTEQSAEVDPTPTPEEVSELSVVILNGTSTVGLTQPAADELSNLEYVVLEDRLDAVNKPYGETVVVALNAPAAQAQEIAGVLNAATIVGQLPGGETASSDVVIILGEDYARSE